MNDILYIALVLDDESSKILREFCDNIVKKMGNYATIKPYYHHMTIAFRTQINDQIMEYVNQNVGERYPINVIGYGVSEKAIAAKVQTECPSMNDIKHITLATINNGKPVDSNYITEWFDCDGTLPTLYGTLEIIRK